ncbi:sulfite exporter TauE/SafE family protein [Brevibacterium samyangense]|uniref:Probable membrane transporter protein n=1 Tax=Brevibacterium samyangense TaxID=366888 RepID=A0ABN2TN08_9MICO
MFAASHIDSILEIVLVLLAGVAAGGINAVVGSGTLVTFPALVAFGVPPVVATMSNAVGLVPGNVTGALGYREELRGQGKRVLQLIPASLLGALTGAYLLLHLPEDAFQSIVPVLLILALVMVITQPALQKALKRRKDAKAAEAGPALAGDVAVAPGASGGAPARMTIGTFVLVVLAVYGTAVYGGYFAAAQGIILIGFLGLLLPDPLQRLNGLKNVLVLVVNLVAGSVYVIVGWDRIDWTAVLLVAVGSLIGGYLGARVGRKFNPTLLRGIIVVLGLVALVRILLM